MRITARISSGGHGGLTRLPFMEIESIDSDLCTGGKLDESKCRRIMNVPETIQIADSDTLPVFAFAAELLVQVRNACRKMIEDHESSAHDEAETRADRIAERNMAKDRVVFVRTDIRYSWSRGVLTFFIDVQNPKETKGDAYRVAKDYALIVARIAKNIARQLSDGQEKWAFDFKAGDGYANVYEDVKNVDEYWALANKRETCENRVGENCSPICPSCALYKCGKCMKPEKK